MPLSAPQWITHIYWPMKESFLLAEDTYEDWVMFIIEQGSFRYRIGQLEGVGLAGDIVVCPPHRPFVRETIEPLSFHFILFGLNTDDEEIADYPAGCIALGSDNERLVYNNEQLRRMASEDDWPTPAYREHIMQDIWYLIVRQWRTHSRRIPSTPIPPIMRQAADTLSRQAFYRTDIRSVAHELGLTPVQFTRQFQAAFRITPIRFVTSIRVHKACKLLADTDWTLDRIALACGYENGYYLSRMFLKEMNMRPSEYRRIHQV